MMRSAFGELRKYINERYFVFKQARATAELSKFCGRPVSLNLIQGIEQGKNKLQPYHADGLIAFLLNKDLISEEQTAAFRRELLNNISVTRHLRDFEDAKERVDVLVPPIQPALLLRDPDDVDTWLAEYMTSPCIGRDDLIEHVLGLFEAQPRTTRVMISDFGGTGKSTVAAWIVARFLQRVSDRPAIWIDVGDGADDEVRTAIGRVLKQRGDVQQGGTSLVSLLKTNNVGMIVLDNVWRGTIRGVVEQLPKDIAVLITARQRLDLNVQAEVALPTLPDSEALQVFRTALRQGADVDDADARDLCAKLKNHPLAIKVAAASINYGGLTPAQVADNLDDYVINNDIAYEKRLITLIEQSLEAPGLMDKERVRSVFYALGALFAPSAPVALLDDLFAAQGEPLKLDYYLMQLHSLSLIAYDAPRQAYSMHDLVFACAASKATAEARRYGMRACSAYVARYIESPNQFTKIQRMKDNLLGAARLATTIQPDWQYAIGLLFQLAFHEYFDRKGYPDAAIDLLRLAADHARESEQYRQAHYLFIKASNGLTEYRRDFDGALAAALAAQACALAMPEGEPGEAQTRQAISLTVAGAICVRQNNLDAAAAYFDEAERIALAPYDPVALSKIYEHRGYFHALGRNEIPEAVQAFHDALMYARQIESASHRLPAFVYAALNLGQAARIESEIASSERDDEQAGRKHAEALGLYQEVAAIADSEQNDDWRARAAQETGELFIEMNRPDAARDKLCEALALYESLESPRGADLLSYIKANRIVCVSTS